MFFTGIQRQPRGYRDQATQLENFEVESLCGRWTLQKGDRGREIEQLLQQYQWHGSTEYYYVLS